MVGSLRRPSNGLPFVIFVIFVIIVVFVVQQLRASPFLRSSV